MYRSLPYRLALVVAVVALISAGATPAFAAAPPPGPVIVQGVAYDADGSTAEAGQTVLLTAWPVAATLATLADGEQVPTLRAGTAVTDADGAFTLRYSDPAALASYASHDGIVNFSVDTLSGSQPVSYSLSRSTRTTPDALAAGTAEAPAIPSSAAGAEPVRLVPAPAPATGAAARSTLTAEPQAIGACTWVKLSTIGPRWVQVGEGYTTTGVTAKLTYTSGSSSTLGVGYSTSGSVGSFTASGTTTVSSAATIAMSPISSVAGRYWKTEFVYSKFGYACGGASSYSAYEMRATSFAGGAQNISVTAVPSVPYCTPMPANTSFTKSSTAASTFSTGAALAGDIGINLSSKTGFTSTTKITYTFTAAHRLCGAAGYPGGSPSRLAARP